MLFKKAQFEEVTELKSQIKSQCYEMKELYSIISKSSKRLSELTPENEILKSWVQDLTHFARIEVNEIIRIEKFFPGSIELAVKAARKDFQRNVVFDDFIEGAKLSSLTYLKEQISEEQRKILSKVQLDSMTIQWGRVKEYNTSNLILVPKDLQDMFAAYIYIGNEEHERKLISHAKVAFAVNASAVC